MVERKKLTKLKFKLNIYNQKPVDIDFECKSLIIAGYTGRNIDAVNQHIEELKSENIPSPDTIPAFWQVTPDLLTTDTQIQINGERTNGEIEFVILKTDNETYVTVGSDHTDRKIERSDFTLSKQKCAKIVSDNLWLYDDLVEHWDDLILRSWTSNQNGRDLYQQGNVSKCLKPTDLLVKMKETELLIDTSGLALYCGTLSTVPGKMIYSDTFYMEIEDPIFNRKINHSYKINKD